MSGLSPSVRGLQNSAKQIETVVRIDSRAVVNGLTSRVVHNFDVALHESLDPIEEIAKNLGAVISGTMI